MTEFVRNEPTPEGRELGRELARLIEPVVTRVFDGEDPRCASCAFRAGTVPNACPATLMNALKCALEGEPFYCHMGDKPLCAGWIAWQDGKAAPVAVPWDYVKGADRR